MIRHLLTTKAILLVTLAALQGLVLAAFPMVNYWRSDIESPSIRAPRRESHDF